jgi:hypothetical protein
LIAKFDTNNQGRRVGCGQLASIVKAQTKNINLQSRRNQCITYYPSLLLSLSIASTLSPLIIIKMARVKQTAHKTIGGKANSYTLLMKLARVQAGAAIHHDGGWTMWMCHAMFFVSVRLDRQTLSLKRCTCARVPALVMIDMAPERT